MGRPLAVPGCRNQALANPAGLSGSQNDTHHSYGNLLPAGHSYSTASGGSVLRRWIAGRDLDWSAGR